MCLGHLLLKANIPFEIAHLNFHLRGDESDEDENFIREWAKQNQKVIHVHHVDTNAYASEHHISTQMAAREIRYEWFEKILSENKLAGVILGHHKDDQIETIFLNLLRGTGIEGVYGMAEVRANLIRPLLPFSRQELLEYCQKEKITWREDSSNEKPDYKRNKLRHVSLPALYEVAEDAKDNLLTSFARLKDTGRAFTSLFDAWKQSNIRKNDGMEELALNALLGSAGASSLIYFWLRPFGFNSDQAQAILHTCKKAESGKLFESSSHIVNIDRDSLFLAPKQEKFNPLKISSNDIRIQIQDVSYDILKFEEKVAIDQSKLNAMMDLETLDFPLEIRTWEEGDRFIPLGLNHSKKVSDFLIDLKVPLLKKSKVKVLLSGNKIAWVIGYRLADWAKTTSATQKTLYFKKRLLDA